MLNHLKTTAIILAFFFLTGSIVNAEIKVNTTKLIRKVDRHLFLSSNIAIWNNADTLKSPGIITMFRNISPGILRMPGGSEADMYFWNGNGVRHGNNSPTAVDITKYKNYTWDIDYSDWAPGFQTFRGFSKDLTKDKVPEWHGNCDVRDLHNFIKTIGAQHLVSVNAGTGTPRDAAEWVKWANKKMGYKAKYWEMGNELDQSGEGGYYRADGSHMDSKKYAEIFNDFALAMHKEDPNILIGGPAGFGDEKGYIPDLLKIAGDQLGFISIHDYYTVGAAGSVMKMFSKLPTIKSVAKGIKEMIKKYRPDKEGKIPIGLTEWNSKLDEDFYTADVFNALWSTAGVCEMLESELDYACQWDGFTQKESLGGGHGLIIEKGEVPKSQYWAFYMINNYFGDEILETSSSTSNLKVYSSRDQDGNICIMAVNISTSNDFTEALSLDGFKIPEWCESFRFSGTEYKWDPVKFNTPWNTGPTRSIVRVNSKHEFFFPAYSVTALRFQKTTPKKSASIVMLGPDKLFTIVNQKNMINVLLLDQNGKPLAGKSIDASFHGKDFVLVQNQAVTTADGTASFEFQSPNTHATNVLAFSGSGATNQISLESGKPVINLIVPAKIPDDAPALIGINLLFNGSQTRPVASFNGEYILKLKDKEIRGNFKNGVASLGLGVLPANKYKIKVEVPALGLTSDEAEMVVYGMVEKEHMLVKFDNPSDSSFLSGNGKYSIENSTPPHQGVVAVKFSDFNGQWKQDYFNFEKLDKIEGINYSKAYAITFDMMIGDDFSDPNQKAGVVFAMQSFANFWMTLKEIPVSGLKKNQWTRIRLDIDNPDWRKAMAEFYKIMVVFTKCSNVNGTLYFDNLGFVEKVEK